MTSAYDQTLTVQTLGEREGSHVIAEVKFCILSTPARFGGKSQGRPDFWREKNKQTKKQAFLSTKF